MRVKEIYELKNTTALLQEKKEHLTELLELSKNQKEYIDQEDLEDLLRNIAQKQVHISALEELQVELNGRRRASVEDAQLAVDINSLVEEIAVVDRSNQQMVRDRMNFVKSHITKLSQGRRSHAAYNNRSGSISTFDLNR